MTDYTELIRALRYECRTIVRNEKKCKRCKYCLASGACDDFLMAHDAAAAIEELQREVDELREAQTYIDRYGDEWMTSAKDVPTAAYKHGYFDGMDEAKAQMPKRGEWIDDGMKYGIHWFKCSSCGESQDIPTVMLKPYYHYCPNCGAKMEVQE